MGSPIFVDVFAEDRAHEAFLVALTQRIAKAEGVEISARVRSGRGGHAKATGELKLYCSLVEKRAVDAPEPDLLVAGIDGNCSTFAKMKEVIEAVVPPLLADRLVVACPDPHVERWYMADPDSFQDVVGPCPAVGRKKCVRDHYKRLLAKAVRDAGHPPTLSVASSSRPSWSGPWISIEPGRQTDR